MLERIAVVDVLRAFALLGIVITHAEMGFLAGPPPAEDFMRIHEIDDAVHRFVAVLIESKFFSIFAFLFGLSFAIQLERARQKGTAFAGRFAWRLIVLLFIGLAHQLLFNGDILMIYALLGLLLIPLGRVSTRLLCILGLLLVFNVPGIVQGFSSIYATPPTPEEQRANAEIGAWFMAKGQGLSTAMNSGSLVDIARVNLTDGLLMKAVYQAFTGRLWITFGCFLIGVCAWRARLFEDSPASRRFFRRLLVAGGTVAAVTTAITLAVETSTPVGAAWLGLAANVQKVTLAASYVAAVTLWYWRYSMGLLAELAPLGKMGLTTYLLQSVFLAIVFYGVGFGMMGELGHAAATGIGIAFFVVQVFMARWWLARMSMGPVEWLWRSATQFRWQPLRVPAKTAERVLA
jgi:uncharacterized protein